MRRKPGEGEEEHNLSRCRYTAKSDGKATMIDSLSVR
jgi:hypothetical protein